MTPHQFTAALTRTKLKPRAASAARRVLVDGLTKSSAAREAAPPLSPEAVRVAVARIERAHKAVVGCPAGWDCLTVCVPRNSAARATVIDAEEQAWRAAGLLV